MFVLAMVGGTEASPGVGPDSFEWCGPAATVLGMLELVQHCGSDSSNRSLVLPPPGRWREKGDGDFRRFSAFFFALDSLSMPSGHKSNPTSDLFFFAPGC